MIYIVHPTCRSALRVSSATPDETVSLFGPGTEFHPDRFPCFVCGKKVAVFSTAITPDLQQRLEIYDVNPTEAIAAMHGLGLPSERDCSAAAVEKVLSESPIKRVATHPIRNSHRCVIEYLELENGAKLYFGSSAYGAVIYRITRPQSYVERIEDHPGTP